MFSILILVVVDLVNLLLDLEGPARGSLRSCNTEAAPICPRSVCSVVGVSKELLREGARITVAIPPENPRRAADLPLIVRGPTPA
jgi:hypothetical protein